MKTISDALRDLLKTRQFWVADLYTITLKDGTVLRYTTADIDLTSGGNNFSCGGKTGPFINRKGNFKWSLGLQVNSFQFDFLPAESLDSSATFLNTEGDDVLATEGGDELTTESSTATGFDVLIASRIGVFDYADVLVERAFMPTGGDTSPGTVILFNGLMGAVQPGRSRVTCTVNSYTYLLNIDMPRNIYQAGCINTLYDSACTISKAAFAVDGAAGIGSTMVSITSALTQSAGYFDLGTMKFTSGQNKGLFRGIKKFLPDASFTIMPPLPYTPAVGDTFTVYPGCDKTQSTCQNKFSNLGNFRGFPYIPVPETAV